MWALIRTYLHLPSRDDVECLTRRYDRAGLRRREGEGEEMPVDNVLRQGWYKKHNSRLSKQRVDEESERKTSTFDAFSNMFFFFLFLFFRLSVWISDSNMSTNEKTPKELMEYRYLGRTGLKVSLLSFGAWVSSLPSSRVLRERHCSLGNIRWSSRYHRSVQLYEGSLWQWL